MTTKTEGIYAPDGSLYITLTDGSGNLVSTTSTAGGTTGQVQYNNAGVLDGFTVSGDGTLNTSTGALAVTKTGGVAFAASATTNALNASNISSGTLAAARGGAGTINGVLAANGSGIVSQGSMSGISDYSTGTWTPTLTATTPGTPVYTTQTGGYTKIGQLVVCQFGITTSSLGGLTGTQVSIAGLPFSCSGHRGAVIFSYYHGLTLTGAFLGGLIDTGTSLIALQQSFNNGSGEANVANTALAAATAIYGVAIYHS